MFCYINTHNISHTVCAVCITTDRSKLFPPIFWGVWQLTQEYMIRFVGFCWVLFIGSNEWCLFFAFALYLCVRLYQANNLLSDTCTLLRKVQRVTSKGTFSQEILWPVIVPFEAASAHKPMLQMTYWGSCRCCIFWRTINYNGIYVPPKDKRNSQIEFSRRLVSLILYVRLVG